ncbi:hypothetical protein PIB30_117012 [Stylosanthes scabra]|uniref:Retrotransposon gag domain-containing protein n=1 Tax=Stylosanthes scabra TaxID=79078 RepID=A0ABU6VEJ9_9FABA|nr:hypothetical protein [Stylosanthes scabra]
MSVMSYGMTLSIVTIYQGDRFRVAELNEEVYALKQGDMTVTAYFAKLKNIWEEIDDFRTIPGCDFVKCDCRLGIVRQDREEDRVTKFLRGLGDQYSTVESEVMLMDNLPSVNKILSMITQHERQLFSFDNALDAKILASVASSSTAAGSFQTEGKGKVQKQGGNNQSNKGQGRSKLQCTHCGKTGHIVDICYKKHGYPPNFKPHFDKSNPVLNCMASIDNTEDDSDNLSDHQLGRSETTTNEFTLEQREALLALLSR